MVQIDQTTSEGARLAREVASRIIELRNRLEDVNLSERETQAIRGALQELKSLVAPPRQAVVAVPSYSNPRRGETS